MRVAIAIGTFALLAPVAATAVELTPDLRAKLDRMIDEKTQQVCTEHGSGDEPTSALQQ
jgi:hypothetical protein